MYLLVKVWCLETVFLYCYTQGADAEDDPLPPKPPSSQLFPELGVSIQRHRFVDVACPQATTAGFLSLLPCPVGYLMSCKILWSAPGEVPQGTSETRTC